MRRLLLLLALSVPAVPQDIDTFYRRLTKFDEKYVVLLHTLCGWPSRIETVDPVCRPGEGHFDLKQLREARDAAKSLFDLAEPTPRPGVK